jgi:hypothetical protein
MVCDFAQHWSWTTILLPLSSALLALQKCIIMPNFLLSWVLSNFLPDLALNHSPNLCQSAFVSAFFSPELFCSAYQNTHPIFLKNEMLPDSRVTNKRQLRSLN